MLDLSSLIGFLILGTIGWITYKLYIWPSYISSLRKIPGPPSDNLLYGNIKQFLVDGGDITIDWIKKYGNILRFHRLFNLPVVLVADAKVIQEIAVTNTYSYVKPRRVLGNLLAIAGDGLLFGEGDVHKRQRKMMNPAFIYSNIKEMVPTFTSVSLTLKRLIEEQIDSGESKINLNPYISKATLDIIGLVGFDYEFNSLTSSNELAEAYDYLTDPKPSILRIVLIVIANYIPFIRKIPIDANKKFNSAINIIRRASKELVEEKYRKAEIGELNGKDLLSILIRTNKTLPVEERMTDDELKYQIMTFLVAGHETTSVSLCWALYLLAKYPHEQDLLREELIKAFPDKSKFNPTFDEINSLEYLNCIVKETLRLHTPVTAVARNNINDETFGEYFIPKDTLIMIPISAFHRLPSIWGPTANDFDPKRWLDPSSNISSINYLPFFTGPRTCIGNKLSLIEFKLLLSLLIRNFVFQPIEGFHIRKGIFPIVRPDPYLGLVVSKFEA